MLWPTSLRLRTQPDRRRSRGGAPRARRREPLPGSNRQGRTWLLRIGSQVPAYLLLSVLSLLAIVQFVFLIFSAFKPYIELTDPFPTFFFLFPSVLINSPAKQTLPLLLTGLRNIYLTRYDVMIAGSLLTVLPVLVAYAFSQRTFVRGAQTSGLKG